jgi:DNA-binding CsgD family transcriptional regulator/tetratricopeptide (TPR) repeat protein
VFAGGFTLDAAESVTGTGASALDLVSGLVDKSLLQRAAASYGAPRFMMLETIREYALEQLAASGETIDASRAHARYFTALAEQAEPDLRGPSQQQLRDTLEAELDNLRAALTWTLGPANDPTDAETGQRLVGALWYFWFQRGLTGEARRWLNEALAKAPSHGRARAQALLGAGTLAWRQGDYLTARSYLDDSAERWRQVGDPRGLAEALHVLGHVRFDQGDFAAAGELFQESSDGYRVAGDTVGGLPLVADLGLVAYHEGDYATAETIIRESLALYRQHGLKDRVAGALNTLGDLARLAGDNARATALYEESLTLWRQLHGAPGMASALHKLGQVSLATRNIQLARTRLSASLALQQELGNKQGIAECLAGLAATAAAAGRPDRAAQIFAAGAALVTAIGAPLAPVDRLTLTRDMDATRKRLGTAAWESAWTIGSALSMDEVVRLALSDDGDKLAPVTPSGGALTLSPRELEVGRLLARGFTNREIAGALSISEKTVGSHIDHIMTKVGLRSRTRIALWAVEHRLGDGST